MPSGKKIGATAGLVIGIGSLFHNPNVVTPADTTPVAGGTERPSQASVDIRPPAAGFDLNLVAKPFDADPNYNEFSWQLLAAVAYIGVASVAGAAAGSFVDGQTK
jgi:hypothetical protein